MKTISELQKNRFPNIPGFPEGFRSFWNDFKAERRVIRGVSRFRVSWDIFIVALIFVSGVQIPYQIAFQHIVVSRGTAILYIIDFFFIIDIVLNFFTSYRYQGVEITDHKKTARHYLKRFFPVDLLANFPFELIFLFNQDLLIYNMSPLLVLRIFRLLRIVRLFIILRRWEELSWINSGYMRIVKFFAVVMLLIHWIACLWFLLAFIDNFPEDSWVALMGIAEADPTSQYIRALYWSITTMTTVGYGDITASRNIEFVFTSLAMLVGASLYAYIVGNIASLVSNLDSARVSFSSRIEAVTQYLHYRQAPHDLNERVRDYYEYLWARHRGLKEDVFFEDLPKPLRLDVLLYLTRELLETVPLFKYCSPSLRNVLLMTLKTQTYAPEGYIVREGELGKEIYFISRGRVEITSHEGQNNHGTLEDGEYFGDLSLILGENRTGSVKALTYCEVFILVKEDFNRIKSEYPEFTNVLKKMSSEKTEKIMDLVLEGVIL